MHIYVIFYKKYRKQHLHFFMIYGKIRTKSIKNNYNFTKRKRNNKYADRYTRAL